jgi:hypothetical protein
MNVLAIFVLGKAARSASLGFDWVLTRTDERVSAGPRLAFLLRHRYAR